MLALLAPAAVAFGQDPLPRNVRIVVTGTSERTARQQGVEAAGAGRVGDVRIGAGRFPPESGVVVRGTASRSRSHDQTRQELLVMSGGRGEIVVAKELPYVAWFQDWGQSNGLWQPGIQWKEVGARMVVEPIVVNDDTLRVRLTPAFSYLVDGRSLTTSVTQLSTEVIAREGQEIDLGGVPFSDRQFLEKFLVGFDESGETVQARITLKASID
jgi:type II/III secretion system protein